MYIYIYIYIYIYVYIAAAPDKLRSSCRRDHLRRPRPARLGAVAPRSIEPRLFCTIPFAFADFTCHESVKPRVHPNNSWIPVQTSFGALPC